MKMTQFLKIADFFTMANLLSGVCSILFAATQHMSAALIALLVAVFFDWIDGKIARMSRQIEIQRQFGKELDSLADIVSFGVAPAVFGFLFGLQQWWQIVILFVFVAAGMLRLARFNVTDNSEGYEGLPITTNGILFPLLFSMNHFLPINNNYFAAMYLVMAYAMLSTFRVKKVF